MCGIAGLYLPRDAPDRSADIPAMLRIMAHRGPDGEKQYQSENRRFQAGFKRLAIIDLETGDQPIVEGDGRRVLLGNGEIYNYVELKRTPEVRDYSYQSSGDMEVILPLHTAYGDNFVDYLNGMFALALYEADGHRLTLTRDRLGIKPLYWAEVEGGGIVFASEIKSLMASGLVRQAIDESAVSSYLAHGYVPAPATLFKGINKLAPGHRLIASGDGSITIERYWRPRPASNIPTSAPEIEDHLTALLTDSLKMQLRSDVPLGALLSGGLDSGLMAAIAAGLIDKPLETFTVRFEGSSVDETPLAAMVSRRYGTNHHELDLPATGAGDHMLRLAWHTEEPLNDAALLPNFMIEQALGKHLRVALNGTGGDELFAGYGRYFQMPVERAFLNLPGPLRSIAKACVSPMRAWQLGRAEHFDGNRGQYVHDHTTYFPAPVRELIGNAQAIPEALQAQSFMAFDGDAQSGALIADLESYLPEDLLLLLDRSSMAASVEGRVPFLDHRFVEAALAVPADIRTPGGEQKALERRIAAKFLPVPLLDAPKRGFASPVPAWMRAGLGEQARRLLCRPESLERGWWSEQGIDTLLANLDRHACRIYSLVMLELAVR
ncbi:MAG: asparagine synthase (glutamine-hydrolyzing) [Rhodospirillaceae bacterium]|nr:asparagine synthase (glutamine-hydrolyzing) [Rhodospirillaceae bacterium]